MNADVKRNPSTQMSSPTGMRRSRQSLEFESFWRNLPKQGAIPQRSDFNPARAGSLLRSVMLLEVRLEADPSFLVRLVGTAVMERIQRDITGQDYLEFLSPEFRSGALETTRLMLHHPCGLWQITPLHYERGLAENFEMTAFPLMGDPAPFLIGIVLPRTELVRPIPPGNKAMLAGTATEFELLDVGAGVPAWPPSATVL
jgi:hypothetical protein